MQQPPKTEPTDDRLRQYELAIVSIAQIVNSPTQRALPAGLMRKKINQVLHTLLV